MPGELAGTVRRRPTLPDPCPGMTLRPGSALRVCRARRPACHARLVRMCMPAGGCGEGECGAPGRHAFPSSCLPGNQACLPPHPSARPHLPPACPQTQTRLSFGPNDYPCGGDYRIYAWASNEAGESANYTAYSNVYTFPACFRRAAA